MKKRILGLDTGTNSLGWAIVDQHEDGKSELVDRGTLIFKEGVKIENGIESSKAAERTEHRALRRHYFRRRLRKIEVLKVLIRYDLCPALTDEDLKLWHNRKIYPVKPEFMLWQRTSDDEDINPYHSRYVCLTEQLDLTLQADRYTLGRALYHLAQRRGFLSNRLDTTEESESGKVKEGIGKLSAEMAEAGCEYLGEYFYKLYHEKSNEVKIRSRYTDRLEHYDKEFKAICSKQQLPEEMVAALTRAIYFQRPLKSQRHNVGQCTFEKGKIRCSDSHPLFEEFRKLSFLNNVRVKGPDDTSLRPLNEEELAKIESLFYRVSKPNFEFEDIAKAIAGKNKYCSKGDKEKKPYIFNFRMSQGVSGCPTTAQLRNIFGSDWKAGIAECYTQDTRRDGSAKSLDEMANDIWNVLYYFDSKDRLITYATEKLQLDEELAKKFSNIRLSHDFGSLSFKAIRNIIPFLRQGMLYSHAVFMGKIADIAAGQLTPEQLQQAYDKIAYRCENPERWDNGRAIPIDVSIKEMLVRDFHLSEDAVKRLYHPSMIESYPDARPNKDGVVLLGSPLTNAVKNPMAMRSLHEIRKVVNQLILEGKIDPTTEVHIEYARELNNANMRYAINEWQRNQDKLHKKYADEIRALYKNETGKDIEPTATDVLKYQLWEEQGHICLYTGDQIGITQFIGAGPLYDIEHTIPQSVGGDSTQENLTLCQSDFNRFTKRAKIPVDLGNHAEILDRITPWQKKIADLTKQIDKLSHGRSADKASNDKRVRRKNLLKMERSYWQGKVSRFTMTEVPEGFARRQGAGIGLVSKYAALYLKSYFHDVLNPDHRQIYTIKGATTAEFRRMWGLQSEYEKKSRDNHAHHCIDAIVIACIGKRQYDLMAHHYHTEENARWDKTGQKPKFDLPWPTFTEDVISMTDELLVVHDTPDNMPKKASRRVQTKVGKVQAKGDSARGSLHMDTYYGAIEREGEVRYVVRRAISSFKSMSDVDKIVDDAVRETVRQALVGKDFKKAIEEPIFMNEERGILIKKVRCYANDVKTPLNIRHHRDASTKEYKQQFHVANDSNYCMAIYEGVVKGKVKRSFEIVNMLVAAKHYRESYQEVHSMPLVAETKNGLNYRCKICTNTQVLLLEAPDEQLDFNNHRDLNKRLYQVAILEKDGRITLRYHQEARSAKDIEKAKSVSFNTSEPTPAQLRISLSNFHALVEGVDFTISPTGEISPVKKK